MIIIILDTLTYHDLKVYGMLFTACIAIIVIWILSGRGDADNDDDDANRFKPDAM